MDLAQACSHSTEEHDPGMSVDETAGSPLLGTSRFKQNAPTPNLQDTLPASTGPTLRMSENQTRTGKKWLRLLPRAVSSSWREGVRKKGPPEIGRVKSRGPVPEGTIS